ncbi:MAG TPA: helix-turn-helix transcriptional regulator, partial [Candidatus Merdenecus merdavium]|nr:helix-turn-helix transcriptional regulator [Candidatus Merdenecus merdavium]
CNYALENTYSGLTVSSVAKELNVNRSYLSRIFKEDTGKNLSRFLNEIKVDEAKRLLKYSNMSLVNISFLLGFSTQNYFQKIFKDITKQTPLEYRKGVSQ